MQSSTPGKMKTQLFFLVFLIFNATLSYGQSCPSVDEPIQTFCDTERPLVADLQANGSNVVWYAEEDATTPLDPNQELINGQDYFAGLEDASCTRESVRVTIYGPPVIQGLPERLRTRQVTENYVLCIQPGDGPFYLSDIETNVPVNWYVNDLSQDVAQEEPLSEDVQLTPGVTYYAERADVDCRTTRSRMIVGPLEPSAEPEQSFCAANDPRIMDIDAAGQNRYYDSPTDFYALNQTDPLIDGKTYWVSRDEVCESDERVPVTVTIIDELIHEEVQEFCAFTGTDDAFPAPTVADLQLPDDVEATPAELQWYSSNSFSSELEPETELEDGASYYLPISNCEYVRVEANLQPRPNAGADTADLVFCESAAPFNLVEFIEDSALGAANTTGSFSPELPDNILDPAELGPGDYTFTYTVPATQTAEGEEICPADSAEISLTIAPAPDTGGDRELALCAPSLSDQDAFIAQVTGLLEDVDPEQLSPSLEELYTDISAAGNVAGTYTTTYTLTDEELECEASAEITLNIGQSPSAGGDTDLDYCASEGPVDLLTLMNEGDLGPPDPGGSFSPALASGSTVFDPAVDEPGTYTYTVEDPEGICEPAEASVTINFASTASAGEDTTFYFCDSQGPQSLYALLGEDVSPEGSFDSLSDGTFDPSAFGAGEMEVVYTVQPTDECGGDPDTATYTLVVSETPDAPQPAVTSITACASEFLSVGDLEITGENILWYTDEALTEPALAEDLLVSGTYYATQTSTANCESAASSISVTINDAPTPSITQGGATFCSYDRPSIASLEENMSDTGITWYDAPTGGNILSTSEPLQNGTVYYASLSDPATGCESSERLAVTAVLENCPLAIPEAFSPNGDGINDLLEIEFAAQEFPNYSIEIFNRWGKKVFTGNASRQWDGTSDEGSLGSSELPIGVYFYIFHFNDGQTEAVQGRVYLSR